MARPGPAKPQFLPVAGRRDSVYAGDFLRMLNRNGTRGGQVRFVINRFAKRFFVPEGCATLYIGRPDPRKNIKEKRNRIWGPKWNVPVPQIPEFEILKDAEEPMGELAKHGWRWLLRQCLVKGYVRPTEEVKSWLGPQEFYYAKSGARSRY